MSLNPSSTMSTDVNGSNQFGSQKGSSGYLDLGLSNGSLKILDEIQLLYEDRMKTLDTEAAGDADQLRVLTLQSWVKDLGEQNGLLVRTVEELEREMTHRVMLLEEKFHVTSHETHKFMTRTEDLNNKLQEGRTSSREFMSYPSDLNSAPQDYSSQSSVLLETQISHLKNDRENLCKLIQRGLRNGNWSTKRFQFYEINDEDIFGPSFNYSNLCAGQVTDSLINDQDGVVYRQAELQTLRQNQEAMERELDDRDRIIKDNLSTMKAHIDLKDEQIRDLKQNIQTLQEDTRCKSSASVGVMTDTVICISKHEHEEADIVRLDQNKDIVVLSRQLQDMEFRLDFAVREKERCGEELASVHRELHFKVQEAAALTRVIADMDKASKDKQAALSAEVADKHDQMTALRRECLQLEEQCRQAAMQTTFKDGIIKEMRKEIKNNRAKLLELEQNIPKKLSDPGKSKLHQHFNERALTQVAGNKDRIPDPSYCLDQSRPHKLHPTTKLIYPARSEYGSGDQAQVSGQSYSVKRSASPPSKDTPALGDNTDIGKIEEKDKLIAYLEARISTLQMAALPSNEIDRLFFNKGMHLTASSVTFLPSEAESQSELHEELVGRERTELEYVRKPITPSVWDQETVSENELVTSLREQQSIIDQYCRKFKELEEELARTKKDLNTAQHKLREKDELLHSASKWSIDENTPQEQLERSIAIENALNKRDKQISELLSENQELWDQIKIKEEDLKKFAVCSEAQQNQKGCVAKEKRIRMLIKENRKMFRKVLGKDDRLRHIVQENLKMQKKVKQLRTKLAKIYIEQQKVIETITQSNTRLESQLQDAWTQLQAVDNERLLDGKKLDIEDQCSEESISRVEEMRRLMDSKNEEIKIWKLAINNLQLKHDALSSHINHQEKEMQDLKLKLSSEFLSKQDAEESEQLLGILQIELESCRNANTAIQNEMVQMQHKNQASNAETISLKAIIKDLQYKLDLSEMNYATAMSTIDVKQTNLVDAAYKEAALQEEFTNRERELLERLRDAQAEELKLTDVINEISTEVDRLTAELKDKDDMLQAAHADLQSITQQSNQLKFDLEMLDQANKRLLSAQDRLESLEKKSPELEMLTSVLQKVNQKQKQHICVLKDRLNNAEAKYSSAQQQLQLITENQSVLEENYRLLQSRNITLSSELISLDSAYQTLLNDTAESRNDEVVKVQSTHTTSSKESHYDNKLRYLCEVVLQKETEMRRLYYENSCLLKTIKKLFAQNSLLRKKLETNKENLRLEIKKNTWPQLNRPDSTLANVVVVTQSELYSTNSNNSPLYAEHEFNSSTAAQLPSLPVICHEYQSTTFTNEHTHPPSSPRGSQFSCYRSETVASHAR